MTTPFVAVAKRIYRETEDLDRVVAKAVKNWEHGKTVLVDQDVYMDSAALNMHGFYSGIERLFEQIARRVDGSVPTGTDWHRQLLDQVSHEWHDIRPAVISRRSAEELDEFRRFRHVVRNVYAENFIPDRIDSLIQHLRPLWIRVRVEILAFADFLTLLDSEIEG